MLANQIRLLQNFALLLQIFALLLQIFALLLQIFALLLQIFALLFGINCTRINQSQSRNISMYIIIYVNDLCCRSRLRNTKFPDIFGPPMILGSPIIDGKYFLVQ